MKADAMNYELELTIKEGTWNSHCPYSSLYVKTSVDGVIDENDNTKLSKITDRRVVWNKTITKKFSTLEPATPIMISMSMYRKRTFHVGYQLVGTAHFSLYELIPILNKGAVQGKVALNMKKNHPAETFFVVALKLQSIPPTVASATSTPTHSPMVSTPTKPVFSLNTVSSDIEAVEDSEPNSPEFYMKGAVEVTQKRSMLSAGAQFSLLLAIMFIALTTCGLYHVLLD